jgi:hypothetical protein
MVVDAEIHSDFLSRGAVYRMIKRRPVLGNSKVGARLWALSQKIFERILEIGVHSVKSLRFSGASLWRFATRSGSPGLKKRKKKKKIWLTLPRPLVTSM